MYQSTNSLSPSQQLGIRNGWLAYQINEAVHLFGMRVEGRLSECQDKFQRGIALREMLNLPSMDKKINLGKVASVGGTRVRTKAR